MLVFVGSVLFGVCCPYWCDDCCVWSQYRLFLCWFVFCLDSLLVLCCYCYSAAFGVEPVCLMLLFFCLCLFCANVLLSMCRLKHAASGMQYLEQNRIVHRDLALRNLLVTGLLLLFVDDDGDDDNDDDVVVVVYCLRAFFLRAGKAVEGSDEGRFLVKVADFDILFIVLRLSLSPSWKLLEFHFFLFCALSLLFLLLLSVYCCSLFLSMCCCCYCCCV